jgi:hypothetical protein
MRTVLGSALAGGARASLGALGVLGALATACSPTLEHASTFEPSDGLDAATPAANEAHEDASTPVAIASCDALKQAQPNTPDGFQLIDPDGDGPMPGFRAWCDMTQDFGGWMLVTEALVAEETNQYATTTHDKDIHGGLILRAYVNHFGCGEDDPTRQRFMVEDLPAWTRLRLHQSFTGVALCWHIFGELEENQPLDANMQPFAASIDTVRDAVRMGGKNGDAFDGVALRCDELPGNFWDQSVASTTREATVTLRRRDPGALAGLSTGADCGTFGDGTTSPTYWEYRDIYVK